jgi:hypothetical protein
MPSKALKLNACTVPQCHSVCLSICVVQIIAEVCCWGAAADSTESDAGLARQQDKIEAIHLVIGRASFYVEAQDGVPIEIVHDEFSIV